MRIAGYPLGLQPSVEGKNSLSETASNSTPGFGAELKTELKSVANLQQEANQTMQTAAVQGTDNIQGSMIKLEEADISLRLLVQIRDKALNAYQDVMQMQF